MTFKTEQEQSDDPIPLIHVTQLPARYLVSNLQSNHAGLIEILNCEQIRNV